MPNFRNNSLLFARAERHMGGAHGFSADSANKRKLALEKSMTIEQIKQAQNPLGKNENQ